MAFVPLHVYSGYSFLRSALSVEKAVRLCKKRGFSSFALTDFESLSGLPEFFHRATSGGLTPLAGMDIELDGARFTFLVRNEEGYRNLLQVELAASRKTLNLSFLKAHQTGLIAILDGSFCPIRENPSDASLPRKMLDLSKGFDLFYLGISYLPGEAPYLSSLRSFAENYGYSTVAFPFFRYEKEEDAIVLKILAAIEHDEILSEKEALGTEWFLDQSVLESYYSEDEIRSCETIASSCKFELIQKRGGLLRFPTPDGSASIDYLRLLAEEGLKKRNPHHSEEYEKRLAYELSVIEKMGYPDYFLLVSDYVHYAKEHGISVGPGRGSGAGSLVSYALGIVKPDPIRYGLLFERFLNPERQTMPDIDVDFADVRRDEVIAYLQSKYGVERVSHILTLQTLGARASIRDIGRVYALEQNQIDLLAKAVENPNWTLREAYKAGGRFKEYVDSDPFYLNVVRLASKIEGLPRQAGLHAAGVVLNDAPLDSVLPVSVSPEVGYVAGFEMNYLEEQGFLKMDLLGLRNLTIVDQCVSLIEKDLGVKLEAEDIPYDDEEAIRLIASTKTLGLFQLESPGMIRAISEVKPTSFEDIVAILSLFRPGPMENIPSFARRKAGLERVSYPDPCLKEILDPTYGIIVYQEQIMQIVRAMAGFSYGQADLFRRAISKKDAAELASLKQSFLDGAKAEGRDPRNAERVYELIERFADYGFNRSHALCYAILTCQMAYLKAHYPKEFYCAILDSTSSGDPKFPSLLSELKKAGIRLLPPSIAKPSFGYEVEGDAIRFPLSCIKSMQGGFLRDLVSEQARRPFLDLFDFAVRMKRFGLNQIILIKLIDSGSLDCFGYNRPTLRLASSASLDYASAFQGMVEEEDLLVHFPKPKIVVLPEDRGEDLRSEKETIGIMLSGSPLDLRKEEIAKRGLKRLADLPSSRGDLSVCGVVSKVRVITTKKGTRMAFLTLYDEVEEAEFTLFSDAYDASYPSLKEGNLVEILARKDARREGAYLASLVKDL